MSCVNEVKMDPHGQRSLQVQTCRREVLSQEVTRPQVFDFRVGAHQN